MVWVIGFGSSIVSAAIAYWLIRGFWKATFVSWIGGPVLAHVIYGILSKGDPSFIMWLPISLIFLAIYTAPVPLVVGLGVRRYRVLTHKCVRCGVVLEDWRLKHCLRCLKGCACPKCGYALIQSQSGCPECGWNRVEQSE